MEPLAPYTPPAAEPAPAPAPVKKSRRVGRRGAGGIGAALIAFGAKAKVVILAIAHFKLLISAGTMLISVLAYGSLWGLPFAAGFVGLLFIHEMGHVIQLRREGIRSSLPMFIPFLGAVVTARLTDGNAATEARVGMAGPVLGSLGALACFGIWHATGNDIWRGLAYSGVLLNLFNLIPVVPLDGGRAMAAMTPALWLIGLVVLIGAAVVAYSPIFLVIIVFAVLETWKRWQAFRHPSPATQRYYNVAVTDRILIAAVYAALVALLAVGMHATYVPRTL